MSTQGKKEQSCYEDCSHGGKIKNLLVIKLVIEYLK